MDTINKIIVDTAQSFVGQKEVSGNKDFIFNPDLPYYKKLKVRFVNLMMKVGWQKGQAWCAYFGELVWKIAYQQYDATYISLLDKLFNASAVQTYKNFYQHINWTGIVSETPVKGAIVVWQVYRDGKPHWTGHLGVIMNHTMRYFYSAEGNTNEAGEREGTTVLVKKHTYDFHTINGKRLMGFIHPVQ